MVSHGKLGMGSLYGTLMDGHGDVNRVIRYSQLGEGQICRGKIFHHCFRVSGLVGRGLQILCLFSFWGAAGVRSCKTGMHRQTIGLVDLSQDRLR